MIYQSAGKGQGMLFMYNLERQMATMGFVRGLPQQPNENFK